MPTDREQKGSMDPALDEGAANRGKRPSTGSGEVHGSGANAGGGGTPEDFDSSPTSVTDQDGGR